MRWLPLLVILCLTGLIGFVTIHQSRDGRQMGVRLLVLGYFAGLGIILFTPISFDGTAVYVMPAGYGQVNLTRLNLFNVGFDENILLTLPLGWLIKRRAPRTPLIVIGILGLIIGGSIEVTQYYMSQHWLINRSSDINDVLANGIGVALGGMAMAIVHQVFQRTPVKSN